MTPALLLVAAAIGAPSEPVSDLKLPPNFTAKLYADHPLAPDIYTMTIDSDGRILVSGRGYVRVLTDADGDGSADRAIDLIDGLKDGPMGLLVEGDSLFVVSDGGLKRYRGYNGNDKLKDPETILALKTGGEHDAHTVRRGPDGWLYVLCGNSTGVKKEALKGDRSPVKDPIAGVLLRLSPDFKTVEVVADGFRNPYSFDFNLDGEPFTYDSDNERCVGLPWYEGCRFYHIVPGGNYGWRSPQLSQTWRKPPYFADVVPPICDTGRGSPTGVVCYRHTHFPKQYQGGFFFADWTFGRIYHVPLKAKDSSYSGKHEIFAEATGTSGFAPTALAVHPKTGELFVSIGGRGTRGAVYRVTYDKAAADPQPLATAKRSLDYIDRGTAKQWMQDCKSDDARRRRLAMEMIQRWTDKTDWGPVAADAVKPNLSHADRLLRRAAGRLALILPVQTADNSATQARLTVALAEAEEEPEDSIETALAVLLSQEATMEMKLEATRVIQLAFGDFTSKDAMGTVFEGYTFRKPPKKELAEKVLDSLKPLMNYKDPALNNKPITNLERELARIGAGLGGPEDLRRSLFSVWLGALQRRASTSGDVRDDIHLLACWARLSQFSWCDEDDAVSTTLLRLERRRAEKNIGADRHWGTRIDELAAALFPGHNDHLRDTMLRSEQLGRLEHLRFVRYLQDRSTKTTPTDVARKFLAAAERDPDSPFAPLLFQHLPQMTREETAKVLNAFWERPHLQDSVVRVLAAKPEDGDQRRLIVGLQSLDPEVVRLAAKALAALKKPDGSDMYVAAIKALRRLPDDKPSTEARAELVALLQKFSEQKIAADAKAWGAWLTKHDVAAAKKLDAQDGFDSAAWQKRAEKIDWAKGNAERGRLVFAKATCAACHDRAGAIGPSLLGISKRFSRDDLLTAILQPSKDVSARFRPSQFVTNNDKTYTGIVIYEATDGVILQTNADTLVRFAGSDIASKKQVEVSLMPAGLLDKLNDGEIADLLAYLQTLGTK